MTIEERRKLQEAIRHNRIKKSSDTASENKTTDKYSGLREAVRNGRIKTQPSSAPSTEALQTVEPLSVEEKEDIKAGALVGLTPKKYENTDQVEAARLRTTNPNADKNSDQYINDRSLVIGYDTLNNEEYKNAKYTPAILPAFKSKEDGGASYKTVALYNSVGADDSHVENQILKSDAYYLTPNQREVVRLLGSNNKWSELEEFVKGINSEVEEKHNAAIESNVGAAIKELPPVIDAAVDTGVGVASMVTSLATIPQNLKYWIKGEKIDLNDGANLVSTLARASGKAMAEKIDNETLSFLYEVGQSVVEMAAAIGVGNLAGAASGAASLASKLPRTLMSASAAAQTVADATERGLDPTQAVVLGSVSAAASWFLDKIPLDDLLKIKNLNITSVKEILENAGKQALSEGGEEVGEEIINMVADAIVTASKGDSNIELTAKQFIDQGMSSGQAYAKAIHDALVSSFAGGALAGGFMGGVANTGRYIGIKSSEKKLDKTLKKAASEGNKEVAIDALDESIKADIDTKNAIRNTKQIEKAEKVEIIDKLNADIKRKTTLKDTLRNADWSDKENINKILNIRPETGEESRIDDLEKNEAAEAEAEREAEATRKATVNATAQNEAVATESTPTVENAVESDSESVGEGIVTEAEPTKATDSFEVTEDAENGTVEVKFKHKTADHPVRNVLKENNFTWNKSKHAWVGKADANTFTDSLRKAYSAENATPETVAETAKTVSETAENVINSEKIDSIQGTNPENIDSTEESTVEVVKEETKPSAVPTQTAQETPTEAKETKPTETTPEVKNAENSKEEAKTEATESKSSDATAKAKRKGKLHNDIAPKNKRQKESLKVLEVLAEALGVDIYTFESPVENGRRVGENGRYDTKTGNIYIDLYAGNNGESVMLYTAAHELTHFIRQWSPDKYNVFTDFLIKQYGEKGVSVDDLVQAQIDKAKNSKTHPRELSYDEALEEVVADSCQAMLTDTDVVSKIAELKAKDESLWEKIRDFFIDLADRIRAAYENLTPYSEEGRAVADMLETAEQLKDMWMGALVEASENYNADGIITEGAVITDENGVKRSIRSMKQDLSEGKMFEDLKTYCGYTEEKVDALRRQIEDLVEFMIPYRKTVDMNEEYGKKERKYSPFKPNSDPLYKVSLDFSTLCTKRLLTQHIIEELQVQQSRALSAEEQLAIRDMLIEYEKQEKGIQVACAMCYVEAARLKSPKQINKWLDDIEKPLRNYFADKNSEFAATIQKAQEDFKESRGYSRDAAKKDMENKDVKELNKIRPRMRENYKPSNEEMEIIRRAKQLPRETFLKAENLATLSENEPEVYSAYTNFVRTATRSKALETPVSYYYGDSYESGAKGVKVTDSIIESMNEENGLRFSSWSDWRIQHLLDYMTAVIDLSVRKAKMHGYTKFPEEVRVLGKTGMMFNMSGVPGNGTGLNPDGSLSFSKENSIDPNDAITLREEFAETAGFQCIGVSDAHIKALLDSDIIDYVIPYHKSGLNATLRKMAEINGWKDYESVQHAKNNPNAIKPEGAENWQTEPSFSEFFVGYDTGMSGIKAMRASADRYIELCKERGLTPKFNDFVGEDNYWKLLIDRKMINQKTGKLIVQKAVEPNFDFDTIKSIVKEYAENYDPEVETRATEYIQKHWNEVPKRIKDLKSGKVKHSIDTLANTTVAATPKSKLSDRDSDYLEAVNRGDMETAQKMVDEAAKAAGYDSPKLYHGTNAFGFTEVDTKKSNDRISFFATDSIETAGTYSGTNDVRNISDENESSLGIYQLYGNTDGMLELDAKGAESNHIELGDAERDFNDLMGARSWYTHATAKQIAKYGKQRGYAGVVIKNVIDSATPESRKTVKPANVYIFFDPKSQIKSADPITYDDNGNVIPLSERFNAENDDIRYSERDSSKASYAPTFYSHMEKVVDGIRGEKMGADGVVSYLKGKGVKDEEIKWSGIEAFLEGKKSVTKAELQEYVAGSQLQIEEEISSGDVFIIPSDGAYYVHKSSDGEYIDSFEPDGSGYLVEWSSGEKYTYEKMMDVIRSKHGKISSQRWREYRLDGGENYRELVFKIPDSYYTNTAMKAHWGADAEGVLAHARIQDMTTSDGKKMLFVEEIQSDWHNEGHKSGYEGEDVTKLYEADREKYVEKILDRDLGEGQYSLLKNDPEMLTKSELDFIESYAETLRKDWGYKHSIEEYQRKVAPDAPFRNNYHEYVLKRLIRMAAEEGYDSIGWTTADIQSDRWSDEFAEGYRIEYDQDIPKFLRKYGKKWGAEVRKATLAIEALSEKERILKETELKNLKRDIERAKRELARKYDSYEKAVIQRSIDSMEKTVATLEKELSASLSVWSMDIPDSMKESVLYEGQTLYSARTEDAENRTPDMSDIARSTVKIANARGITVETQDFADMGNNAPEAYWNEASRKIVLNAKAKRNAAMLLGHEMFHTLPKEVQRSIVNLYRSEANTDSAEFKEFKADRMKKYKELYARDGRNFTEADFWTEFAAESSETLFTSKRIIEKVSDRRPPIAKQILRWIRDSLRSIVMHEDYTYSAAAKAANLTVDTLRKAENMYAKALNMPTADNIPDVKAAPSYAVNADNMGYGENVGNVADNGETETETEEKLSANEVYESGKKRSENAPWYDTASRFIREMWHKSTRVMSKIPESGELGKFYSYFRNRVLAYKMHYEMSSDRAVRLMQKMFVVDPEAKGEKRHLSKEEYETFNKVVFFRDLKETAEIQMEKGNPVKLPGGITLENVLKTLDEIEITPRIQTALDKRRAVWDELKRKYIEAGAKIGYDLRGKLLRKDYFRHEVLKYATDNFKRSPKKMKANDKASYLRQRVGSEELINSDFASVEFIALQQMIYDTMTMDNILAEMKKQYDIKPKLVRQAKAKNRAAMDEYIRNEAKETLIKAEEKRIGRKLSEEEIKDLEPTFTLTDRDTLKYNSETQRTLSTYTGKMRWALEKLQTLAEDGALDEFGNDLAVESLKRGYLNVDVNELIQTIASLDTESDATVPALTYLKNARLKEKFVKETLGDKFATWETELKSMNEQAANAKDNTLASVQYKVFQPRDGRYMFAEEVVNADSLFTELGKKLSEKLENTTATDTKEFLKEFMDENIQTIFKAGSPYEQWVIPETMVEVMTDISNKPKTDSTISKVMSAPLNLWKRWVTGLNPLRAARYHVRNIFGDAEAALTGNAKILSPKRVGSAWKDAWNALSKGEFTNDFKEWYDMGGTSATFTIQEMTSKEAQKVFEFLRPKGNETFKDMMKKFANAVAEFPEMANKFNEVRESVLRFSAYKVIKDELNENGGKVKNYYASKKAIVDGLPTIELKAMQLSQDLLGNYGGVSETGQFMRKYFVPFWSFMETNVKRYYRLLANPISGIAQGVKEKDTAKVTSNSAILAKQSAKALAVYMALAIWNALHNDDEEKLPESVRNIPHITLGSVNGHVIAFTRLGNLLDIGEWLGIDDLKIESAEELYQAPIDKAWSILTPYIKMPIELVTGQNHYPSIFNPTYIRDRWQYMANNLGVVDVYNFIAQKPVPQDSIVDTIANLFVYTYEEESTAYSDAVSMRYDFEGSSTTKSIPTPKSNALYYMKQAMRYGDTKKALKYMNDYFDEGGTGRGLVQSLAYLDPRYGISKEDEEKFYGSMNESDREKFDLGVEFYEKYLELPSAVKSYLRNTKDAEKAREYMATYITNYVSK